MTIKEKNKGTFVSSTFKKLKCSYFFLSLLMKIRKKDKIVLIPSNDFLGEK